MFPKPKPSLKPNTYAYESQPMVKATGFREYDARWLFGSEINLMGVEALGMGLGTLFRELGVKPEVVVGHDFRGYSASVKMALVSGLMAAGCKVHDIGLAVTPMAYFAQFDLDVPCVAMVTASHNDNGWTGVKMGANRPLTFGPDEMTRLKDLVLNARFDLRGGGSYAFVENFPARYIADLTNRQKLRRRLKVVCACGNGTAGAFAPQVLEAIGCEVVALDCELDHTFPKYNPNTEDMKMLHAMRDAVLASKADVGLGFDGDGDRCGVVDNEGEEIFADKVGVLLARDISAQHKGATFVADVKSTGLFVTDHVAALRRRDQVPRGRRRGEALRAGEAEGREGRRPADPRPGHRQRRARHRRGRHLGSGSRLLQQAGAGGGGREPGLRGAHARHVQCGRRGAAHASRGRRIQSDDLSPAPGCPGARDAAASGGAPPPPGSESSREWANDHWAFTRWVRLAKMVRTTLTAC